MSLKLFRRGQAWYIRGTVAGQYVYESAKTSDSAEAKTYRDKRQADLWEHRQIGNRERVTFAQAALSYLEFRNPGPNDRQFIIRLLNHFCPTWDSPRTSGQHFTLLDEIDQVAVDKAVKEIVGSEASPATKVRAVITPLSAIMNHAARRKWCDPPCFEKPKQSKGKTRWLTPAEAEMLIQSAADHLRPLIVFLLGTGARMSEALDLTWDDVDLTQAHAIFRDTKGGKIGKGAVGGKDRRAALPSAVVASLSALKNKSGHVFRRHDGKPYADRERMEGGQIKKGWLTACKKANIGSVESRGEKLVFVPSATPHDLRHTWASWFYALTRDLLLLKDEGGWSTLSMVERYAHLTPSSMINDIRLIWGDRHPRIGVLPGSEESQHSKRA
ncbi:MAG: site-specific integrase [Rhodospirillales bacterium]|nr:site-specific integrase [Rhodospirillales bacterium]